jgi:murein DD-endopeptidase MepM/ murein hydrolase activator NlpD
MSIRSLLSLFAISALVAAAGGSAAVRPYAVSAVSAVRASGARVLAPVTYAPPLPAPLTVLRRFTPPATPYGPGHLGVDLRAAGGMVVHAAAAGVVRFAGPVAGRGVVVIEHTDGIRTEYEPVRPLVRVGARLRAGAALGVVRGRHAGCSGSCLHWGARRGERYVDPLGLLRPLGPVVLLPWPRNG